MIKEIQDNKPIIAREIIEDLSDWFAIEQAREEYISNLAKFPMFVFYQKEIPVGFISLDETSLSSIRIYILGVKKAYHRKGFGKDLVNYAFEWAKKKGYEFIFVETVEEGLYKEYDATNKFYQNVGFKKLNSYSTIWDESNPCQIYVKAL